MTMSDSAAEQPSTPSMPNVNAFKTDAMTSGGAGLPLDDGERNPVFASLVTGDGDVIGLVAYSIYKQNKHDWLLAFLKARSREPDEAEVAAYIIGESTPRRLATYRHLAQATLEGKGPDVQVAAGRPGGGSSFSRYQGQGAAQSIFGRAIGYVATALIVIVVLLLAIRFGVVPSPK
jgi:hypothetical protein